MQILIAWLGRATSYILFHGPAGVRRALAYVLAFLWFDVFRIRRDVVDQNLQIAFPNMESAERVRVGRASLRTWALNLVEYCYLPWLTPQNYEDHFVYENEAVLKAALARGRGVLLITLHLGHGDLACAGLSLRGYPMVMISKFFKFKWLNDAWFGMRERLGTRFIPPRDSSYAILKALKRGATVVIPLDQFTGPPIGVRTTFFGKETGTAAGPAVMAERSGAAVVTAYTFRDDQGRHVIHFESEVPVEKARDSQHVTALTQQLNFELEKFVRLHPDQWMWIHRRWKEYRVT